MTIYNLSDSSNFKKERERERERCLHMYNWNHISLDMELVIKGFLFHKGLLKIVVSKLIQPVSHSEFQPISQSSLVEISCVVSVGQVNNANKFFLLVFLFLLHFPRFLFYSSKYPWLTKNPSFKNTKRFNMLRLFF